MSELSSPQPTNPRLTALLSAPILPLLSRLSAPNIGIAFLMTVVTIADAWFVGRLGTVSLAALAIVFPVQTLMNMMSAGAMGGGISSAVARSLGSGQPARAEAIVLHALIIALGMSALYVIFGAILAGPLFSLLGGSGEVLAGAVAYAHIVFGAGIMMWLNNTFASVLRGTGNMLWPATVQSIVSVIHIGLSGAFTLGWGPFPEMGIRGPAIAVIATSAIAAAIMGGDLISGRFGIRLRFSGIALKWELFRDILKVGAVACGNALLTIATVLIVTRLVATQGVAALAGYGLGSRLELILIPLAFGVGGAMTASVGINFGAQQYARARRIAWSGGLAIGIATSALGIVVAIWPDFWLNHFTNDPGAREFGTIYLQIVGPLYGFFGMGMALYFASQGTGNMIWPFTAGCVRLLIAAGGGAIAIVVFGAGSTALFVFVAAGLLSFGGLIVLSLFSRVWNPKP